MPRRPVTCSLRLRFLLPTLFLLVSSPASAALIQVDFTGVVAVVPDAVAGGAIEVDDRVVGRFVYDTSIVDSDPDPDIGFYGDAVQSFEIAIGDTFTASMTQPTSFRVVNDQPSGPNFLDAFLVNAQENVDQDIDAPQVNGRDVSRMQWGPSSIDATRVLSDAIPDVDALLRFLPADGRTNFNFVAFGGIEAVRWNQDGLTARVVPEPHAATLLGLGLAGLALVRRPLSS